MIHHISATVPLSLMKQLLLIALSGVILAVPFAVAWASEPKTQDAKIVSELKALGGEVMIGTDASGNPDYAIVLSGTQLNEQAVEVLKPMKVGLVLMGDRVSDATLEQIRTLQKLQGLALVDTGVTDRGMEHVEQSRQLHWLEFKGAAISDAGIAHIGTLTNLISLDLLAAKVTDTGLKNLEGLSKLQSLGLSDMQISDSGLPYLKPLVNLRQLNLSGTRVTDAGMQQLEGMVHLENLTMSRTKLTGVGFQYLNKLDGLRILLLPDTNVTDAGLEKIGKLIHLQELCIDDTKVSDVGLEQLRTLTNLKVLGLTNTRVTDDGVKRFQAALPNCRIERREKEDKAPSQRKDGSSSIDKPMPHIGQGETK